ncbi:MAG: hypothetical protein J0L92_27650, partial [Deltaproteobacteria bacterium]|nr:hypothetical protein [Deltaproteobacteria bacterium]
DAVLDNITYTYDLDGNRTTRRRGPTIGTSVLETYEYEAGDELVEVSVGGTPTQTWGQIVAEHHLESREVRVRP